MPCAFHQCVIGQSRKEIGQSVSRRVCTSEDVVGYEGLRNHVRPVDGRHFTSSRVFTQTTPVDDDPSRLPSSRTIGKAPSHSRWRFP